MTALTRHIADFVTHPQRPPIPGPALDIIRTGFIDTIATMMAGWNEPATCIVRRYAQEKSTGAEQAHAIGGPTALGSAEAALINGTAGHALDFDDVALSGHPSTVLVPAILAEGERLGSSGAQAMHAYLAGYEVWAELLAREPDPYHAKGWHPTAVLGTIAATAAVARLNELSATECAAALGVAGSLAGGLVANFGTMTKPLHAGRAAANAVDAVRLIRLGLNASEDILEHPTGYLAALSPAGRVDRVSAATELGTRLRILEQGLSIKRYPVCYGAHRVIDGALALAAAHDIDPRKVVAIDAQIGAAQNAMLRNTGARTGLEAKFSLEFALACALIAGDVGLSELNDTFVQRPDIQALMARVRRSLVHTMCPIEPVFALHDRIRIHLADGRVLDSGGIRFARGNAQVPLTDDEVRNKFMNCAANGGFGDKAMRLYDEWIRLEHLHALPALPQQAGNAPSVSQTL